MRANIPTDNDYSAALPVVDEQPVADKVSQEQKELAKIGNSPDWSIIQKYLDTRIEVYKNGLFGEDLTAQPTEVIGQRFLAAQSVIQEFQSLKDAVAQSTEVVEEANNANKAA